jgi:hypothetical protein
MPRKSGQNRTSDIQPCVPKVSVRVDLDIANMEHVIGGLGAI